MSSNKTNIAARQQYSVVKESLATAADGKKYRTQPGAAHPDGCR